MSATKIIIIIIIIIKIVNLMIGKRFEWRQSQNFQERQLKMFDLHRKNCNWHTIDSTATVQKHCNFCTTLVFISRRFNVQKMKFFIKENKQGLKILTIAKELIPKMFIICQVCVISNS